MHTASSIEEFADLPLHEVTESDPPVLRPPGAFHVLGVRFPGKSPQAEPRGSQPQEQLLILNNIPMVSVADTQPSQTTQTEEEKDNTHQLEHIVHDAQFVLQTPPPPPPVVSIADTQPSQPTQKEEEKDSTHQLEHIVHNAQFAPAVSIADTQPKQKEHKLEHIVHDVQFELQTPPPMISVADTQPSQPKPKEEEKDDMHQLEHIVHDVQFVLQTPPPPPPARNSLTAPQLFTVITSAESAQSVPEEALQQITTETAANAPQRPTLTHNGCQTVPQLCLKALLRKHTQKLNYSRWQPRFFVLFANVLFWFGGEYGHNTTNLPKRYKGALLLSTAFRAEAVTDKTADFVFELSDSQFVKMRLSAVSAEERMQWVSMFNRVSSEPPLVKIV